jgi:hypothetical protein
VVEPPFMLAYVATTSTKRILISGYSSYDMPVAAVAQELLKKERTYP